SPTKSPTPSDSSAPADDSAGPAVQEAVADLAERLGVSSADIQAGSLQSVTWPDGSLGCPSPGQSYPQALTEGYRLVLTAQGKEYEYHAGADGDLFYGADPGEPAATAQRS